MDNKILIESLQYYCEKVNSSEVANNTKRNAKIGAAILGAGALALGGKKLLSKGAKKAVDKVIKFRGSKTTPFRGTPKPRPVTNITTHSKQVKITPEGDAKAVGHRTDKIKMDHHSGQITSTNKNNISSLNAKKTKNILKDTKSTQKALQDPNHVWEF